MLVGLSGFGEREAKSVNILKLPGRRSSYFCLDMLPLLADFVRDDLPHHLAAFDVRSGKVLELDAVQVFGIFPLH